MPNLMIYPPPLVYIFLVQQNSQHLRILQRVLIVAGIKVAEFGMVELGFPEDASELQAYETKAGTPCVVDGDFP